MTFWVSCSFGLTHARQGILVKVVPILELLKYAEPPPHSGDGSQGNDLNALKIDYLILIGDLRGVRGFLCLQGCIFE